MYTIEEIIDFVKRTSATDDVTPDTDIHITLGVCGDDFHEMMDKYAERFKVDMGGYLWYFHTDEEGHNGLGGTFFKPPYERVTRIPVTPEMLLAFANKGSWSINYPEHTLPKRRYDLLINTIVMYTFLLTIIILLIKAYL